MLIHIIRLSLWLKVKIFWAQTSFAFVPHPVTVSMTSENLCYLCFFFGGGGGIVGKISLSQV